MYPTMCQVVSICSTASFCTFMNGRLTSGLGRNAERLKWGCFRDFSKVSLYIQFTNWWDFRYIRPVPTPSAGEQLSGLS